MTSEWSDGNAALAQDWADAPRILPPYSSVLRVVKGNDFEDSMSDPLALATGLLVGAGLALLLLSLIAFVVTWNL